MKMDETKIEKALREMPHPEPPEGLFQKLCSDLPSEPAIAAPIPFGRRLAWVAASTLMLAVTAWGAQKIYKTYILAGGVQLIPVKPSEVSAITWSAQQSAKHAAADGKLELGKPFRLVVSEPQISSDDPGFNAQLGQKQLEEVRRQIRDGQGALISKTGGRYLYRFKLADGHEVRYSTDKSLEDERDIMLGKKSQLIVLEDGTARKKIVNADRVAMPESQRVTYHSSKTTASVANSYIVFSSQPDSQPGIQPPPLKPIGKDDILYDLEQKGPDSISYWWAVMPDANTLNGEWSGPSKNPERYREMADLQGQIELGKGRFLETKDIPHVGRRHVYEFTLTGGKKVLYGSKEKLGEN